MARKSKYYPVQYIMILLYAAFVFIYWNKPFVRIPNTQLDVVEQSDYNSYDGYADNEVQLTPEEQLEQMNLQENLYNQDSTQTQQMPNTLDEQQTTDISTENNTQSTSEDTKQQKKQSPYIYGRLNVMHLVQIVFVFCALITCFKLSNIDGTAMWQITAIATAVNVFYNLMSIIRDNRRFTIWAILYNLLLIGLFACYYYYKSHYTIYKRTITKTIIKDK